MMNIRKRITALGLRFASKRKPFRSRGNGHQRRLLFERMEDRRLLAVADLAAVKDTQGAFNSVDVGERNGGVSDHAIGSSSCDAKKILNSDEWKSYFKEQTAQRSLSPSRNSEQAELPGSRRVLIVPIHFQDKSLECSESEIDEIMFSGANSVAALYSEATFGNMTFHGDFHAVSVPFQTTDPCDANTWLQAALQRVLADGVDTLSYDHVMWLLPASSCPTTAYATLGGADSFNQGRCSDSFTYAHELGHNIGFNHSDTPTADAGDRSSLMGASFAMVHFNAIEKTIIGWVPPERTTDTTTEGQYRINSAHSLAGSDYLSVRISSPLATYYVSYRSPQGFDANLAPEFHNRLFIHTVPFAETELQAVLSDGQVFAAPSGDLFIRMSSHTNDLALVEISFTPFGESPVAPTVALMPASQSGIAGATLNYILQITNNDPAALGSSTFNLSTEMPAGLSASVASSVTVAPGATESVAVAVTSAAATATGNLVFSLLVSQSGVPVHSGSAQATYQVQGLAPAAPTLTLSPASQSGNAGSTLNYVLQIQNNDPVGLPPSTFAIARQMPSGLSATVASQATVAAGTTATFPIAVTSAIGTPVGDQVFTISVSQVGVAIHFGSAQATYRVTPTVTPPTLLSLLPAVQTGMAGEALVYTLTIYNHDAIGQPRAKFKIAFVPDGPELSAKFHPPVIHLDPNESRSIPIEVLAKKGIVNGDYEFTLLVTKNEEPAQRVDATFEVRNQSLQAPTLVRSPSAQIGYASEALTYMLTLSNRDEVGAQERQSRHEFSHSSELNVVLPRMPRLAPEKTVSLPIITKAKKGAPIGTYSFESTVSDDGTYIHSASVSGTLTHRKQNEPNRE